MLKLIHLPLSPLVAVVILNWNGRKFLEKFLPSVMASSYNNFFVVVADNGSDDDSIHFLKEFYPQVTILLNGANYGFAKGYNEALKLVKADYFVLLNSDVEVPPHWIEPVIEVMEADDLIAACQPKILSYTDKKMFEYAGACGGWIDRYGFPFARGRLFDTCEMDNGQYNSVQQVFWATGACLFIRAKIFNEVKGFDEYFFAHQEEIDLCWRLQHAGYKIFVQPASNIYHIGGGTLAKGNKRKTYLNFRNNLVMTAKNLSVANALWIIPFKISLNKIFACKALLAGDVETFAAVFKAHFHFIKWLLVYKSKSTFATRKNKQLQGFYNGSVVWQYFIKKKKFFSEIIKTKNDF